MRRNRLVAATVTACLAVALAGIARPGSADATGGASSAAGSGGASASGTAAAGALETSTPEAATTIANGARAAAGRADATPAATSDCSDGFSKPFATGLPVLPCAAFRSPAPPVNFYNDGGADFDQTVTTAAKPKLTIHIPKLRFRIFYILCYSLDQAPPTFPLCPVDLNFPKADPTVSRAGYYGTYASAYVQSPKGVSPQYGIFPPVKVSMLAFGSIPVTATVRISQVFDKGIAQPQQLETYQSATVVTPGKLVPGFESYGPVPDPVNGSGHFFTPPAQLGGPVTVRIDDVKVDGEPLSVGNSCQTATQLKLGAQGGFYLSGSVPMPGEVGSYRPLRQGLSYLSGAINLPAFTGCHNGNEDLNPLITGMVSGPDNRVDTTQQESLTAFGCLVDPANPDCSSTHPAAVASGRLAHDALASFPPSARTRFTDYLALAGKAASQLPRSIRSSLRAQQGH